MENRWLKIGITMVLVTGIILGLAYLFWPRGPKGAVALYFFKESKLERIYRPVGERNVNPERAMRELVRGPGIDKFKGYFSAIPKGTKFLGLDIENGIAYVNFSKELTAYGGGTTKVRGLLAQIVYTLTEFSEISKVRILVAGSGDVVLGSEGIEISEPLSRDDAKF